MDDKHVAKMHKKMHETFIDNFENKPKLPICAYVRCRATDNKDFGNVACMFYKKPETCLFDTTKMTEKQLYEQAKREIKKEV